MGEDEGELDFVDDGLGIAAAAKGDGFGSAPGCSREEAEGGHGRGMKWLAVDARRRQSGIFGRSRFGLERVRAAAFCSAPPTLRESTLFSSGYTKLIFLERGAARTLLVQ